MDACQCAPSNDCIQRKFNPSSRPNATRLFPGGLSSNKATTSKGLLQTLNVCLRSMVGGSVGTEHDVRF
ncbi:hypothetical protein T265_04587 [Opisthorchis viverrini]|uniref:Uncharacterized protein n=1 Tax=Opisthorchis viverrini TaxID=6198 RepID=A0A074ZZB3_OPIVI|nr:hypothetical protein T265_04587 [Opisthorchis viverrini]KER28635.1 hypothetical protein T265_04587 [Opisthorchis viverrini]